jgi:hypothetical protein
VTEPWPRIGRNLILVSLVFGTLFVTVAVLVIALGMAGRFPMPGLSTTGGMLFLLVKVVGLAVGLTAYRVSRSGPVRNAGTLAIIAAFLPPFEPIMLLAGLLLVFGSGDPRLAASGVRPTDTTEVEIGGGGAVE